MKKYKITIQGKSYEVEVEEIKNDTVKQSISNLGNQNFKKSLTAPMPGTIIQVKVNIGDIVTKGQTLIVYEAMKMQNELTSNYDGKVVGIATEVGKIVKTGEVLIIIE